MKIFYQINKLEEKKAYFFNKNKNPLSESELPEDILKVPMGFPEAVLFYPPLKGKIYAYVIDNKGRRQYFYTKEYKDKSGKKKYREFPEIIPKVEKLLSICSNKNEPICQSITMMSECNFRIGHEKYKKLYDTNGTLTLSHKHLEQNGNHINIKFLGKKKEENFCSISQHSKLFPKLKESINNKKQLFNGIQYIDVYNFLKEHDLKPKDIRAYNANYIFYQNLKNTPINDKPKKYLKYILTLTAQKMNHTPTVCKKEYLMPQWFNDTQLEKIQKICQNNNFQKTINLLVKNNTL